MVSNSVYRKCVEERDALLKQLQEIKENGYNVVKELYNGDLVSRQMVKSRYCDACCHPGPFCPDAFCKEVNEIFDCLPGIQPNSESEEK